MKLVKWGKAGLLAAGTALLSVSASAQDLATELSAAETQILGDIGLVQGMMITVVITIVSVGIVLALLNRRGR